MSHIGKLVRLQNGRWARFQRLAVWSEGGVHKDWILAAVELGDGEQEELDASMAEAASKETFVQASWDFETTAST